MRESKIEQHLRVRVKELGGVAFKFTSPNMAGVPDRIVILPNNLFFVELKATGEKPRPLQLHVAKVIRKLGFNVYFPDSIEKVDEILGMFEA